MIQVKNLSKHFQGQAAVDNVSFQVPEASTLVLLGTSGSGKTTILRMINRLTEPSAGEVLIGGRNVLSGSPETLRRNIGYVLQHYGLFPHYTVAENIALVPRLLQWPETRIRARVAELLEKLQLPPGQYRHAYPSQLSGGQKQRVGLARALAAGPPVLLMDEPFGALDPLTRAEIKKAFLHLDELQQKTIILVTHDVQEAFELGDRIGLMDKGRLVQSGSRTDLLLHPVNDFVRSFFSHQRLSLTLKALPLKSLWPNLADAPVPQAAALTSRQSIWEAMECLSQQGGPLTVVDAESRSAKYVTFTDLQSAFNQSTQTG
jgi:osmoprotectant transport system ATP-binding protein